MNKKTYLRYAAGQVQGISEVCPSAHRPNDLLGDGGTEGMPDATTLQGKSPAHMIAALPFTHVQASATKQQASLLHRCMTLLQQAIIQTKESCLASFLAQRYADQNKLR